MSIALWPEATGSLGAFGWRLWGYAAYRSLKPTVIAYGDLKIHSGLVVRSGWSSNSFLGLGLIGDGAVSKVGSVIFVSHPGLFWGLI